MKKTNVVMKWIVILPLILFSTVSVFADTTFLGDDLLSASNWTTGLPAGQVATINSNGYATMNQINTWLNGSTATVGGGAVLSFGEDLSVFGATLIVNDATINCDDDIFCDNGHLILNEGSVTTAAEHWEANDHAGRITVNGGTHSSGPNSGNYVGAQRVGTGIDFRGGTVIAGDFRFQANSVSSIGGGAILTSASPITAIVDISGEVDFASDWNGYWEVGSYTNDDWELLLTYTPNITFEGSSINVESFTTNFLVENNGTTLRLASPKPIPTVTYFNGGNLFDGANWSNGLPPNQIAFVNSNGYYNGVTQLDPWLLNSTVTVDGGATLSLTNDLAVFGSKLFTVNNATINCSDNFVCDGGEIILNKDAVTTANGNWEAIDNIGRIIVNGGTHSSGTNVENYVGAMGNSTTIGCGIDFLGGTVIAGSFRFQEYSSSSIDGDAILASASSGTTFTNMSGDINFISGWSGSWEVGAFGPGDWEAALTNNANFTLDGIAIDEARFGTYFLVENNGTTLKYSFPTFVTHFLGGDLLYENNWTHGLPAYQVAVINSNGFYNGVSQINPWLSGSTVTVGGGAVLTLHADLAVKSATFIVNDATVDCVDDFFCQEGTVILNAGSVTTAGDDWEANAYAGRITVNGGTHSSGTNSENYVGAQGNSTRIGCGIDFRGGTVIAGDFRFQLNSSSSIGGGAILTSASPATTIVDISGMVNFVSDWDGYWEVGSFGSDDWEELLTGNTNITLDSTPIDADRFAIDFIVSDDGTTLSYVIPEPVVLLGSLLLGLAFLRRR